jgi:hypothetical protein
MMRFSHRRIRNERRDEATVSHSQATIDRQALHRLAVAVTSVAFFTHVLQDRFTHRRGLLIYCYCFSSQVIKEG